MRQAHCVWRIVGPERLRLHTQLAGQLVKKGIYRGLKQASASVIVAYSWMLASGFLPNSISLNATSGRSGSDLSEPIRLFNSSDTSAILIPHADASLRLTMH